MKQTRKLLSLLLALAMVCALAATAFAEGETYKITINNTTTGHTYTAYQIFAGDLDTVDGKKVLSNIEWGSGVTVPEGGKITVGDKQYTASEAAEALAARTLSTDTFIKALSLGSESKTVQSQANSTVIEGLNVGYYLVKETSESVPAGEAYTKYILQVVGDAVINVKSGTTTSDKKVGDESSSNSANQGTTWQDSVDYDIGDAVPFKLSATIAQDYDNYTYGYKLTFHDKEETGLTFNKDSVKVYVDGTLITTGYEVVTEGLTDDCTFEVRFANLKAITSVHAGSVISVEYTSTLNNQAVIGSTGNKNTSHVTYTNNPNDEQAGENGKTPDDVVIVFTYKTIVHKVTKNHNYDPTVEGSEEYIPLKGAGFTLYKKNASGEYEPVGPELKGDDMTTFTWSGLDAGDYKLSETTTPAGYNTIADIEFTITATYVVSSANPTLTTLSGKATNGELTFTSSTTEGSLSADVVNNAGSTLPETGGIGTTIFYTVGGILVLVAVVLLVTKKRMNGTEV